MGTGDAGGFAKPVPLLVSLPAPGTAEGCFLVQHFIIMLISTSGSAGCLPRSVTGQRLAGFISC